MLCGRWEYMCLPGVRGPHQISLWLLFSKSSIHLGAFVTGKCCSRESERRLLFLSHFNVFLFSTACSIMSLRKKLCEKNKVLRVYLFIHSIHFCRITLAVAFSYINTAVVAQTFVCSIPSPEIGKSLSIAMQLITNFKSEEGAYELDGRHTYL